ncbi:MAG: hypothetical protein WKF30_16560 [Pyrinomonadaceae bacterium]
MRAVGAVEAAPPAKVLTSFDAYINGGAISGIAGLLAQASTTTNVNIATVSDNP